MMISQPAGVFPLAVERVRPEGERQVYWVRGPKDGGELKGVGSMVTQIRGGGFLFVPSGELARLKGFDGDGKEILNLAKPGFSAVGRPSVDWGGNFAVVEFVGDGESEIWRIPLRGKGPEVEIATVRGNPGLVNPAIEMRGTGLWLNFGGSWSIQDMATAATQRVDTRPLTDGLPVGTRVLEVRPSPVIPKQVAVGIELANETKSRWVMVWDRQSNRVSRVSPIGSDGFQVDWSRDGRSVLFHSREVESGRVTLRGVAPTGGETVEIAVVEEAKGAG